MTDGGPEALWLRAALAVILLAGTASCTGAAPPPARTGSETRLPAGDVDYQLGGDYPPPAGVGIVVRQWSDGSAAPGAFSICYVNAFQTEAEVGVPDGPDDWPPEVVLDGLEDAGWPGEHPIDISTEELRQVAVGHVAGHFRDCAAKGFAAAELDNLDTWTRYPDAPFDREDGVAYASLLVDAAAESGLVVGQKNAAELLDVARSEIGFTFAVVEECGEFDECRAFIDTYQDQVLAVEYTETGFAAACAAVGDTARVVLRDISLSQPGDPDYVFRTC